MIILVGVEKAISTIQHIFMILKNHTILRLKGTSLT